MLKKIVLLYALACGLMAEKAMINVLLEAGAGLVRTAIQCGLI